MSTTARGNEEGSGNHDCGYAQAQEERHRVAAGGNRCVADPRGIRGSGTVALRLRVRWRLAVTGSGRRRPGRPGWRRRRPCWSGGRSPFGRLRRAEGLPANRAEPGIGGGLGAAVEAPNRALARVPSHKAPPLCRTVSVRIHPSRHMARGTPACHRVQRPQTARTYRLRTGRGSTPMPRAARHSVRSDRRRMAPCVEEPVVPRTATLGVGGASAPERDPLAADAIAVPCAGSRVANLGHRATRQLGRVGEHRHALRGTHLAEAPPAATPPRTTPRPIATRTSSGPSPTCCAAGGSLLRLRSAGRAAGVG